MIETLHFVHISSMEMFTICDSQNLEASVSFAYDCFCVGVLIES